MRRATAATTRPTVASRSRRSPKPSEQSPRASGSSPLTWLDQHKQRLVYLLLAVAMVAALGAGTVGGFFLRHAANIERQALRTQQLAGAAAQLQRYLLQAQTEGVTKQLVATRKRALVAADAAFQSVRAH